MGDLEALKTIKEKELAVEKEVNDFKVMQNQKFNDLKKGVEFEIKNAEKNSAEDYYAYLDKVKAEISKKAELILDEAKKKADSKLIVVTDKDLKSLVLKLLYEYLEVV